MILFKVFLLFIATSICDAHNITTKEANVEFSIEEVSVLNRQFLDYLLAYDVDQVTEASDHRCVVTLRQLSEDYTRRERHALEWYDSWGKIPSGLYYGNGYAFGNYEQCRRFRWGDVRGQHCTFLAAFPNEFPIFYSGLCVPQFCSQQVVQDLYAEYMSGKGVYVIPLEDRVSCYQDRSVEFNGAVVTAIVIFSIFAGIIVCSTGYEVLQSARNQEIQVKYAAFSLLRNIRSIMHIVHPTKQNQLIECANGIRALSMIWIIVLHVLEAGYSVFYVNPTSRQDFMNSFVGTTMFNSGGLAVDTFLALSGMLVSLTLLKELDQHGKINPLKLYLRRYLRLTAPFAPMILMAVSFTKYFGEGPLWAPIVGNYESTCTKYWWSALLHVQNYVNPRTMCLPWSWYLSVDMQLYIIAPALIYPLWRWGKRVLIAIGSLSLASTLCVLTSFLVNDFRINFTTDGLRYVMTYYPTHTRMAVWLLGTILGYILHRTKDSGVQLPKRYYALGWTICFALLALTLYATFEISRTNYQDFPAVADAFYESLSRPVFGICVLWIILACVNGAGGVINHILSSGLWQPLARLSFTMYLLHPALLIMATIASAKTDTHFSVMELFYRIWGAIGLSTSVALVWSAAWEVPFGTLERVVLGR